MDGRWHTSFFACAVQRGHPHAPNSRGLLRPPDVRDLRRRESMAPDAVRGSCGSGRVGVRAEADGPRVPTQNGGHRRAFRDSRIDRSRYEPDVRATASTGLERLARRATRSVRQLSFQFYLELLCDYAAKGVQVARHGRHRARATGGFGGTDTAGVQRVHEYLRARVAQFRKDRLSRTDFIPCAHPASRCSRRPFLRHHARRRSRQGRFFRSGRAARHGSSGRQDRGARRTVDAQNRTGSLDRVLRVLPGSNRLDVHGGNLDRDDVPGADCRRGRAVEDGRQRRRHVGSLHRWSRGHQTDHGEQYEAREGRKNAPEQHGRRQPTDGVGNQQQRDASDESVWQVLHSSVSPLDEEEDVSGSGDEDDSNDGSGMDGASHAAAASVTDAVSTSPPARVMSSAAASTGFDGSGSSHDALAPPPPEEPPPGGETIESAGSGFNVKPLSGGAWPHDARAPAPPKEPPPGGKTIDSAGSVLNVNSLSGVALSGMSNFVVTPSPTLRAVASPRRTDHTSV